MLSAVLRWAGRLALAVLVLLLLLWLALRWVIVPQIDHFRPWVQQLASSWLQQPVVLGRLEAEGRGWLPAFVAHDLRLAGEPQAPALVASRARVVLSPVAFWRGGLQHVELDAAELTLRRDSEGRWWLGDHALPAGPAANGGSVIHLPVLPAVDLRGGRLQWLDERSGQRYTLLHDVVIRWQPQGGGGRLVLQALPALGTTPLTLRGQLERSPLPGHEAKARLELSTPDIDLLASGLPALAQNGELSLTRLPPVQMLVQASGTNKRWQLQWPHLKVGQAPDLGGLLTLDLGDGRSPPWQGRAGRLELGAVDLRQLAQVAVDWPLPPDWQVALQALAPQGRLRDLEASWQGHWQDPARWQSSGRLTGLGVAAQPAADGGPGLPGAEELDLQWQGSLSSGQAQLQLQDGALIFPGIFEEARLPLDHLTAKLHWQSDEQGHWQLRLSDLELENPDAAGQFELRWKTGTDGQARLPGVLDLRGQLSRGDGARVYRYLPLQLPQEARDYVRLGIRQGKIEQARVEVHGPAAEVPFNQPGEEGQFLIAGRVSDVDMAYVPDELLDPGDPPWPVLENISGELSFEQASMRIRDARADVKGRADWEFGSIEVDIEDLNTPQVRVRAQGAGALSGALSIIRPSAISGLLDGVLDEAQADGPVTLDLALDLPIEQLEDSEVDGRVHFEGNSVRFRPEAPSVSRLQGSVAFTQHGFSLQDVAGQALGGKTQLTGGMQDGGASKPRTQLAIRGQASAAGLAEWLQTLGLPARDVFDGQADYEAQLIFHTLQPQISVHSELQGLALRLPAPLGKRADERWPLQLDLGSDETPGAGAREHLQLQLGDRLQARMQRDADRPWLGDIRVGSSQTGEATPSADGLQLRVKLDEALDLTAWENLRVPQADHPDGAGGPLMAWTRVQLQAPEVRWASRRLHAFKLDARHQNGVWQGELSARELDGRFSYRPGGAGRSDEVTARLNRLDIPAEEAEEGDGEADVLEPPERLPSLALQVEQFHLHGMALGRLQLQARARIHEHGRAWHLSQLELKNPDAVLNASGSWTFAPEGVAQRSNLDLALDIADAGGLLARLDMPGALRGGSGRMAGHLSWQGPPYRPDYPSMSGDLQLKLGKGQFLKSEPGVARLLGIVSLQTLPRRLNLDFRDLFSSGFAFDSVTGSAQLQAGVAHTQDLEIQGPAAVVSMRGAADLARERQDLHVLVVPVLDLGGAALAAAVVNPAVGLGALLAQQVLGPSVSQQAAREFTITGTWIEPEVSDMRFVGSPGQEAGGVTADMPEAGQ